MMYRGKHEKNVKGLKKYKKSGILLASLLLVFSIAVGTTVAFLMDSTETIKNTFVPVSVAAEIEESFDHRTKSAVTIGNDGTIPAYVRGTAVFYWTDADGIIVQPAECSNTPLVLGSGWFTVGDVFYYESSLAVGESTSNLLAAPITATISPEFSNYTFHMEVHAEAIQAEPVDAVESAWSDIDVNGGKLTAAGG